MLFLPDTLNAWRLSSRAFVTLAALLVAFGSLRCTNLPGEETAMADSGGELPPSPDAGEDTAPGDTAAPEDSGRPDAVGAVDGSDGADAAPADVPSPDVTVDVGEPDEGAPQPGLYRPDDGPSHEGGTLVNVCSEAEILGAISAANPGDVITICPGTFAFSQKINVNRDGQASGRIFLRAEAAGTVTLNLSHIENFNISAKFWVFENITFFGDCSDASGCEHAFQQTHVVIGR